MKAIKTDYQKGITAGLRLLKTMPARYRKYRHNYRNEINALVRRAREKYGDTIGDLVCPFTGEPSYMRTSWYAEGMDHAIAYGRGAKYVVVRFNGCGSYNVDSMVDRTVYDDPSFAWKRSWEADPHGHNFKSIDVLYVNGAAKELGLLEENGTSWKTLESQRTPQHRSSF